MLVINAGSTNVKFSMLAEEREEFATTLVQTTPADAVKRCFEQLQVQGLPEVEAVGHRFVHGGASFTEGVRITDEVVARLTELNTLAPLHNPPALEALAEACRLWPDVPHVAAFDTAFHRTLPSAAYTYPIPRQWTEEWGIRRFGFHGLSHEYCSKEAARLLNRVDDPALRVVVAHLGGGCSLCAVKGGASIDTTMGFTPMDGLMMGTRSGSIDPGILLHVMRTRGLTVDEVDRALNHESGLRGVSGVSNDIREVWKAVDAGNADARLAIDLFAVRIQNGIQAMMLALGGADAVVFTGGIGQHDTRLEMEIRLGLWPIREAGEEPGPMPQVFAIATREDVSIAREVERILRDV